MYSVLVHEPLNFKKLNPIRVSVVAIKTLFLKTAFTENNIFC